MASTYSDLKFELIGTGDQSGTWGSTTNTNIGTAVEQAIVGMATLTSANFTTNVATLTLTNVNTAQNARALCLVISAASLSGAGTLNVPAIQKPYLIINNDSFAVTVKVTGQTGVSVPAGKRTVVYNNGTDVGNQIDYLSTLALGTALPVTSGGTGTTTPNLVAGTNVTLSGTWPNQTINAIGGGSGSVTSVAALTLGTTGTDLSSTVATGTTTPVITLNVPTASASNRGALSATDWSTFNNKQAAGSYVTVGGALGTPSSGTLTNCTFPTLNQNTTGTAAGLSSILAVASGGTGTATPALVAGTNITITGTWPNQTVTAAGGPGGTVTSVTGTAPVVSSGGTTPAISLDTAYGDTLNPYASKTANFVLAAPNGTAGVPTFRAVVAADIPTLNQNTSGTAAGLSATLAVASGGTGVTSSTGSGNTVLSNSPTLVTPLLGTPTSGNLANCTFPTLNQNTTGTAAGLSATLAVASGGTGVTSSTGSGNTVLSNSPTLVTPLLGTPTSGNLANCTFPTLNQNTTGTAAGLSATLAVASGGTGVTTSTGSGNNVLSTSPTLVTPLLGTPTSGNLANCTFPTLNQNTTGSAGSLVTTGFSIVESGGKLFFKYGATNIASLDSSGNFIALANVTAYGTP